jgi:sulfur carrier protein
MQTSLTHPESATTSIHVNGEPLAIPRPATLASLIALRQPRPPFAVEVNKQLVRRISYDATPLADGDTVEIVTLVGGG